MLASTHRSLTAAAAIAIGAIGADTIRHGDTIGIIDIASASPATTIRADIAMIDRIDADAARIRHGGVIDRNIAIAHDRIAGHTEDIHVRTIGSLSAIHV